MSCKHTSDFITSLKLRPNSFDDCFLNTSVFLYFCLELVGVHHAAAMQTSIFWPRVFNGNLTLLN